ncbi:MAG: DegV family protein [Vulcanibacillus sp.]
MAVKVITDSTSYLPEFLINEYNISVVSLSVVFGDEVLKESEIINEYFFKRLAEKKMPTSSQPSVDDFYQIFEENIKKDNEIVGVFISSEMSGTYSTAILVKNMILEKYPNAKIEIIDSRSNCMQLGYAVLTAAKAAKDGKSLVEIRKDVENNIRRRRFVFIPDTLEYLRIGGRIGTASALLGSMLQIKPILTVSNGETHVLSKVRTKKRATEEMVNIFLENINKFGLGEVIVHHINCEEEARELSTEIGGKIGIVVEICSIGPVIGTHVGPGALGIAYYTKKDLLI